jgi:hypothetical protein
MAALAKQQVQKLPNRRKPALVIEAVEIRIVAEAAADFGWAEPGFERHIAGPVAKEFRKRLVASASSLDRRPIGDQPAQHGGPPPRHDVALEPFAIDIVEFGDRLHPPEVAAEVLLR